MVWAHMGDPVIQVNNLGKRYTLRHQHPERYIALRDVMATGIRRFSRSLNPFTAVRHRPKLPTQEDFWALKEVSFEVNRGDRIGIIGRNGAGKSTLLKILSRITEPTTGEIRIRGRVASLLEVGTGFHPELTGRENIYLNGAILGMSRAEIRRKFDEIVAFAEVEKFLDTPVKRYSSGMYVRLAFAIAAHLEPEILIVDEVLAVGDAQFQKKCLGKMEDVAKNEGRTILFVSHNMAAIANLCAKTIVLDGGNLTFSGNTEVGIRHYLENFESISCQDLSSVPNRRGRGNVQFTKLYFTNAEEYAIEQGVSGKTLIVVMEYESKNLDFLKNCRFSTAFYDGLGQFLFNCSSELLSIDPIDLPPQGRIKCIIPKLPLSGSQYFISILIEVNKVIEDWIYGVSSLTVIDGDFYGTGRLYSEGWQGKGVLIEHQWITEHKTVAKF